MSDQAEKKPVHEVILDQIEVLLCNLESTQFKVNMFENPEVAKRIDGSLEEDLSRHAMVQFGLLAVLGIIKEASFSPVVLEMVGSRLSLLMIKHGNCLDQRKAKVILDELNEVQSDLQARLI